MSDSSPSPPSLPDLAQEEPTSFRERLWAIVFEAETPGGKLFDVALLYMIGASVLVVMAETVDWIAIRWGAELEIAEWCFTGLFTAEYLLRLWLSRRPMRYATSFFGVIDLLACLPTYLGYFFASAQGFAVVRVLRLLRVFRVLKMVNHLKGAHALLQGLRRARAKVTVFFTAVLLLCTIAGTLLYFVEGGQPGTRFTSIPISIYYAVVSVSTVGFGDITVSTNLGRFITAVMILTGFAIIAVPSGIVSAEMSQSEVDESTDACPSCGVHGHLLDAVYCRRCGHHLSWKETAGPLL
jgi:voltage-gated potassium channel